MSYLCSNGARVFLNRVSEVRFLPGAHKSPGQRPYFEVRRSSQVSPGIAVPHNTIALEQLAEPVRRLRFLDVVSTIGEAREVCRSDTWGRSAYLPPTWGALSLAWLRRDPSWTYSAGWVALRATWRPASPS
jgi:hypothetical protein